MSVLVANGNYGEGIYCVFDSEGERLGPLKNGSLIIDLGGSIEWVRKNNRFSKEFKDDDSLLYKIVLVGTEIVLVNRGAVKPMGRSLR